MPVTSVLQSRGSGVGHTTPSAGWSQRRWPVASSFTSREDALFEVIATTTLPSGAIGSVPSAKTPLLVSFPGALKACAHAPDALSGQPQPAGSETLHAPPVPDEEEDEDDAPPVPDEPPVAPLLVLWT